MTPADLFPLGLFAALLGYEWALWRFASDRVARGYRNMWLAYAGRVALLVAYATLTGADLVRYLVEDVPGGLALGALAVVAFALSWRRRWPVVAAAVRARPRDVLVWSAYVLFAVAVVEEAAFRGALLLVAGAGPLAYLGSSAAHALWHVPAYRHQWPDRWARELWKPFAASLVLGTLAIVSGSLWAPIVAHAGMDVLGNVWRFASDEVSGRGGPVPARSRP